jgi:uncharacterized protein
MSDHTNALANETSPYLLQHAHNPVDWFPWSPEALKRAKDEDKPILLSIGYSACHWCHVMERESFENEQIASLMNRHFVSIKVDREERPDLDAIYMNAVQMMTGGGGWPMTVFLTPDLVPFFGGTYFPPQDRHGLPGFPRVLASIAAAYRDKKEAILQDASQVLQGLRQADVPRSAGPAHLGTEMLDRAAARLAAGYDAHNGGFGTAPKFPPSMSLIFLLRSHVRSGNPQYRQIVEHTLNAMAAGGIYDHLGGGFHRYSVDDHWLVPHFEKMLYDNALLSSIYTEAWLVTGIPLYRRVVEETLGYVLREMTSPDGGFYSTQDADSEGHEGKFFVWDAAEIFEALGEDEGNLFCRFFGVTPHGNFEGRNILHVPIMPAAFARENGISEAALRERIDRARGILFRKREARVHPGRDEKVLTAWNGLMMRSFAEAANALGRADFLEAARRSAAFILDRLQVDGRLRRSFKDGRARHNAYLEDYAFLLEGLIALYQADFDARWLSESARLAEILESQFWDEQGGAFYFTSGDHESLIYRPKDFYDNATPSGNAAAVRGLQRLSLLTGEEKWARLSGRVLERMGEVMAAHPSAFPYMLCGLDFQLSPSREVAVCGNPAEQETRAMLNEVFRRFLPHAVVACGTNSGVAILEGKTQLGGKPTAYVCSGRTCAAPAVTPAELAAQLEQE